MVKVNQDTSQVGLLDDVGFTAFLGVVDVLVLRIISAMSRLLQHS